jgi:ring-1,2-phenylacetyl-CoA epoxidase subunit PaaD
VSVQQQIFAELATVKDPEIASVSILDLGMIDQVIVTGSDATVLALPTFMGCPALEIIKRDIASAVKKVEGIETVNVKFVYDPPWTTDRISEEGKKRLKEFGIAPPPPNHKMGEPWEIPCPYCDSIYTTMENVFGPTACRSILYCKSCKNPFEAMKPVSNL